MMNYIVKWANSNRENLLADIWVKVGRESRIEKRIWSLGNKVNWIVNLAVPRAMHFCVQELSQMVPLKATSAAELWKFSNGSTTWEFSTLNNWCKRLGSASGSLSHRVSPRKSHRASNEIRLRRVIKTFYFIVDLTANYETCYENCQKLFHYALRPKRFIMTTFFEQLTMTST